MVRVPPARSRGVRSGRPGSAGRRPVTIRRLLLDAQAADEVHHAPARLLSVHLELGEAQALLDDLAIAEIVEGLRCARIPSTEFSRHAR